MKRVSSINGSLCLAILIAGSFLATFALYPQLKFWYVGDNWNGQYAYNDIDEVAYSAYLNALIDGRPRKNDPYSGVDDSPDSPQPESLFSIQFATPYLIAIPARVFGVSAPTAMTIAGGLAGFFAAAACCWLLFAISRSSLLACGGALFVLCGGAFFAWEGAIGEVLGTGFPYPYFPFLRRYIPAVPFPFLFCFFLSIWKLLETKERKATIVWTLAAGFSFSFLLFSYFYLWTAALGWVVCVLGILLAVRPSSWKKSSANVVVMLGSLLIPLCFYVLMLAQRSETMDNVQLLARTHAFDFSRTPILFGLIGGVLAVIGVLAKRVSTDSQLFVFTIATALTPIVLFNQQVLTGMSLQPIHYEVFVGNYIAGLALILGLYCLLRDKEGNLARVGEVVLPAIATIAIVWGFVECHFTVRVLDQANVARDREYGISRFVNEDADRANLERATVFATSGIVADDLPTSMKHGVLWARHQHVFPGLTWDQNKGRYFRYIYYLGHDAEWLDWQLKNGNFVASIALFWLGETYGSINGGFETAEPARD